MKKVMATLNIVQELEVEDNATPEDMKTCFNEVIGQIETDLGLSSLFKFAEGKEAGKHIVVDSNNHWLYTGELADLKIQTVLEAVRNAEDFDPELELLVYEAKEVASFDQDAIENELHLKDSKPIPIEELADEVVLPEMLVYPGDKLDLDFIVEKAHHADHRANKENVKEALKYLVESGDVIESHLLDNWIAIVQH